MGEAQADWPGLEWEKLERRGWGWYRGEARGGEEGLCVSKMSGSPGIQVAMTD